MASRYQYQVLELTQDCELGQRGERAVVTEIVNGRYMTLLFPGRALTERWVHTGLDYRYLMHQPDASKESRDA
jgi:hypothetical protein